MTGNILVFIFQWLTNYGREPIKLTNSLLYSEEWIAPNVNFDVDWWFIQYLENFKSSPKGNYLSNMLRMKAEYVSFFLNIFF